MPERRPTTTPHRLAMGVCLPLLLAVVGAGAALGGGLDPTVFPVPDQLRSNVRFWTGIYGKYTSDQVLIHDELHLDVIYTVVDLRDLTASELSEAAIERLRQKRVQKAENDIRHLLRKLDRSTPEADESLEIRRIRALVHDLPGGSRKYRNAALRVRSQTGLRDRFEEAVRISGRYLPAIEETFRQEGLPVEISRLPFVESMFQSHARSRAGAVGAWQFTLGTGRRYLRIGAGVDERKDAILAAGGAARMLGDDYERFRSWPLAITAYNHGRAGMSRAVRRLGTRDLGIIATRYRSRTFGFASRNFYSEFVAAAQVYADRENLFPDTHPEPPLLYDELVLSSYVSLVELANTAHADLTQLRELNPALSSQVFTGGLLVPKNYPLRIPLGTMAAYQQTYASISKRGSQIRTGYRVRRGDTLSSIALRHGTTVRAIQEANGLGRSDRIYPGQYLQIPSGGTPRHPPRTSRSTRVASRPATTHTVRRGENLSAIAGRYGAKLSELVAANGLASPDLIVVGQTLKIPAVGPQGPTAGSKGDIITHVVQRGETLFQIAMLYGTTVDAIKGLNQLASNLILPNQILRIR